MAGISRLLTLTFASIDPARPCTNNRITVTALLIGSTLIGTVAVTFFASKGLLRLVVHAIERKGGPPVDAAPQPTIKG